MRPLHNRPERPFGEQAQRLVGQLLCQVGQLWPAQWRQGEPSTADANCVGDQLLEQVTGCVGVLVDCMNTGGFHLSDSSVVVTTSLITTTERTEGFVVLKNKGFKSPFLFT